jgi:hypothetical protein
MRSDPRGEAGDEDRRAPIGEESDAARWKPVWDAIKALEGVAPGRLGAADRAELINGSGAAILALGGKRAWETAGGMSQARAALRLLAQCSFHSVPPPETLLELIARLFGQTDFYKDAPPEEAERIRKARVGQHQLEAMVLEAMTCKAEPENVEVNPLKRAGGVSWKTANARREQIVRAARRRLDELIAWQEGDTPLKKAMWRGLRLTRPTAGTSKTEIA